MCNHRVVITASGVTMPTRVLKNNEEYCESRDEQWNKYRKYRSITFCANRTCEKVFAREEE